MTKDVLNALNKELKAIFMETSGIINEVLIKLEKLQTQNDQLKIELEKTRQQNRELRTDLAKAANQLN